MVGMVNAEQLKRLSPEKRVANSYESTFFGAVSGDPETDRLLFTELQTAYAEKDLTFDDNPTVEQLQDVHTLAYAVVVGQLQGAVPTEAQIDTLLSDFKRFEQTQPKFYDKSYETYKHRHNGDTLDSTAIMNRLHPEMSEGSYNAEEPDLDAQARDAGMEMASTVLPRASVSYGQAVAPVAQHVPTYTEREHHDELKRTHDSDYDAYAQERQDNQSHFTAGDEFGFDERDDDGPEF